MSGLVDPFFDVAGRVACRPAFAPFERVTHAKPLEAARRFEELLDAVTDRFDGVFVTEVRGERRRVQS